MGSSYLTQSHWAQTDGTEGSSVSLLLQHAVEGIAALKAGEAQALGFDLNLLLLTMQRKTPGYEEVFRPQGYA